MVFCYTVRIQSNNIKRMHHGFQLTSSSKILTLRLWSNQEVAQNHTKFLPDALTMGRKWLHTAWNPKKTTFSRWVARRTRTRPPQNQLLRHLNLRKSAYSIAFVYRHQFSIRFAPPREGFILQNKLCWLNFHKLMTCPSEVIFLKDVLSNLLVFDKRTPHFWSTQEVHSHNF